MKHLGKDAVALLRYCYFSVTLVLR